MFINIVMVFLYTLVVVISLLLIGIVLIQPAKSGGMGAAFGGIGESVFGAKAGSHLTKATVIMTALFFVLALALAALIGRTPASRSKMSALMEKEQSAMAAPAQPAAKPQAEKAETPKPSGDKPVPAAPAK